MAALGVAATEARSAAAESPANSVQHQKHMAHADEYLRVQAWATTQRDNANQGE